MMLSMPVSADSTRRIRLIALTGDPHTAAAAPRVRRYKMARMAPVSREDLRIDRFAHQRPAYD